ncbi:hypothetical protein LCI18_002799 [Fusarium solani-melongenae]|uniref:Uncharacterized protein n=1 Tax=Fusarium solani subsp. cucurbitae TaxID=2747967 RepID=A0ACD3YSA5_FUSSC|nr:hypothetical protein LCI18_002799 [Fusarium solani-melongenae]
MPSPMVRQHARTGCRTCKTRKVKCDEAKPACKRCVSSRRVCGGYDSSALTWYRPAQLVAHDQREGQTFQFFGEIAGPSLSGPMDSYFWTHLVMQFSHFQPMVRHAVLALGSLYQDFYKCGRISRPSTFAVGHYNEAVKQTVSVDNEQLILLLCVMFICIEYLQGNIDAALQHIRHGTMILNESSCSLWTRDHLLPIFHRLSLIPMFGDAKSICLPRMGGLDASMPVSFGSVSEAQAAIDSLAAQVLDVMPSSCHAEKDRLAIMMDEWDCRVHELQATTPMSLMDGYAICGMRIKHEIAKIHLKTPRQHTELWFDQYLDAFQYVVDLAERASQHRIRLRHHQTSQSTAPIFTFEACLLPLLFFAVSKCRQLDTRLQGLRLMAQPGPVKEGLFDASTLYQVVRRIIEVEHNISLDRVNHDHTNNQDQPPGRPSGNLPLEEKRIFAVSISHDVEVVSSKQQDKASYKRQVSFYMRTYEGQVYTQTEFINGTL